MAHREKNLKDAIIPILWLNWVFCMGTFEIPANRPRFILSIIYVISILVGYFILVYRGITIFEETFSYRMIIFYCVIIINILVATCAIILSWKNAQNFQKLIKRYALADDTLEALGISKNYSKIFSSVLRCIIIWALGMLLLNVMHVVWMWSETKCLRNLYIALCFGFPIMLNSVVDLTFASFIRCIKIKFQNTNILISDVVFSANKTSVFKVRNGRGNTPVAIVRTNYKDNKDMIKHLIHTLRHLHLELTRITQDVNETFCIQLLLELSVHFTIVTATCYYFYYYALSGQTLLELKSEKIIAMITWGSVYSFKIISINNLCTTLSNEAHKTGEIIQAFEGSFLDDELRDEIRQFTQQIMLNSLNFTAAGFFRIDNAFTGAFFATVTTYVVILIQMRTPVTT